jgi:hypothetical protein
MRRRDDARVAGECIDRRGRRLDAILGMKKEQRRPFAALDAVDLRAIDSDG